MALIKQKWTAECQKKAGAAGGIEVVVKAINTHIDDVDVCYNGCGALMNMTSNNGKTLIKTQHNKQMKWADENRVEARTAGGIEVIVKALNTHIGNANVCEKGCAALLCMIYDNSKKHW